MTAPATESRYLRAALAYADKGWFVFPLQPKRKDPLAGTNGFKDASKNLEHINQWWAKHPHANVGLWPGPSGLTIVDIDGPEGEALAQSLGLLREPTLVCHSGRDDGGRHLYFRAPNFPVSNAPLGPHLDIRGQAGYVVVAPSVHPSGRRYRWEGSIDDIRELPSDVVSRLRAMADGVPVESGADPRERPISGGAIGEGGRNNMLTRVAGALLTKHPLAEVGELVWAYNLAHCRPPLERREVDGIVTSLSKRELKKPSRLTDTGRVLTMDEPPPDAADELPLPLDLTIAQVEDAKARGRLDLSHAPRWRWHALHDMVGIMMPGDLVVFGALTGNGKTSFLLSQLQWNADHEIPTLYIPLEMEPANLRRLWAAWELGLDYPLVARNEWDRLPVGAQEQHEATMAAQSRMSWIQFPPPRRITIPELARWCRWGVEQIGARCVVIDHFHRMDLGGGSNYRLLVNDAVKQIKDLGRQHELVMIASAQLNRTNDPLDRYFPPELGRLKESGALGEEADCILMASRRLQSGLGKDVHKAIRERRVEPRMYEEPNTMQVTCRKHRVDDTPRDRYALLDVVRGHVVDRVSGGRLHTYADRKESEC